MKRLFFLLLSFVFILNCYGCDYKDIDRRIFIVAIGIDSINEKGDVKLTIKGAIPSNTKVKSSDLNYKLVEVEADSIGAALRKVKQKLALEPDYSHMKILILGKSFFNQSQDNLRHIAAFFITRRDFQNLMWVTAANPSAKEILDTQSVTETYAGADLFLRFGQGVDSPYTYKKKLSELYTQLNTPGLTTSMPVFELQNDGIQENELAILSKHNRLSMLLKNEQVKMFNILANNKTNSAFIYVPTDGNKILGFNLRSSNTKYSFTKQSDLTICNVNVKLKLLVEEGTEYNIDRQEALEIIENELKCKITYLLEKFRFENVDPLNLQLNYWQYNPSYSLSDEWLSEILPKVQFKVSVTARFEGKNVAR
ncbi:Ger(x)C family spore germination C-terminal domain-containing protein [Clostridium sp. C8-1-8]|uniref:Ger(x)C family spore germination protein n=1 Tax=Clostridium sp. C8-1-8 TaxID=2698831 RepID=UPI00136D9EB4|nr:Ger(x)C family spore germination C-terminal domain-containing protein [Clostridium sp. C8-1-8]